MAKCTKNSSSSYMIENSDLKDTYKCNKTDCVCHYFKNDNHHHSMTMDWRFMSTDTDLSLFLIATKIVFHLFIDRRIIIAMILVIILIFPSMSICNGLFLKILIISTYISIPCVINVIYYKKLYKIQKIPLVKS